MTDKLKPLLLYPADAQKLIGVGVTKFYELVKLPGFPKAKNIQGKRPMYSTKEIETWVDSL